MVVYTKYEVEGTRYSDVFSGRVTKSISSNSAASSFEIDFPNESGKHASHFNVGEEIIIYAGTSPNPTTKIFGGYIEDAVFTGPEDNSYERINVSGRDYTSVLQNVLVQPITYNNMEVSDIIIDVVTRELAGLGITTTNVQVTGQTSPRLQYAQISVFEVFKQLADIAGGWYFFIDEDKDLHFKPLDTVSSGLEFRSGVNIRECTVTRTNRELYNQVWVYGDRVLTAAPKKTYTANGGSIYNTDWKPHNTGVFVGGSTAAKIGGIYNFSLGTDPGSPIQYLVDYEGQRIVFVSGVGAGMNIPISGTDTINIEYDRSVAIAKFAQDRASVDLYGPREYAIVDKAIKDPRQATELAYATLDNAAHPVVSIRVNASGFSVIDCGETAVTDIPYHGIDEVTYSIIEVQYSFSKNNNLEENVIRVVLNKKLIDVADTVKNILLDLKRLRAEETQNIEFYTRLEVANGSVGIRVSEWEVLTGGLGSSFILGHPTLGVLGTTSPQPYLGDSRPVKTVVYSGGE